MQTDCKIKIGQKIYSPAEPQASDMRHDRSNNSGAIECEQEMPV